MLALVHKTCLSLSFLRAPFLSPSRAPLRRQQTNPLSQGFLLSTSRLSMRFHLELLQSLTQEWELLPRGWPIGQAGLSF